MAQAQSSSDAPPRPKHYRPGTGTDRYVRFAEDWLGLDVPEPQRTILGAFEQHRRVIAVGGNGYGKSYAAAAGGIAGLYCNADTIVNVTSGSYGQLDDTIWKPITALHRRSKLPGRTLDNTRELRTELDEEWFLKCLSPKYPADLEGRHNARMLYIIEEADKPGITREHIDSAESTLTDEGDRLLVIANPPADESNVVADLMEHDGWTTLQFPSWESRNVRVDADEHDGPRIPGLVERSELRENWEDWNGEPWPGLAEARTAHERRDDLDVRWYRRRAGVIPPDGSAAWRPFDVATVRGAHTRTPSNTRETPQAVGIDVARSGDRTVMVGLRDGVVDVLYSEPGANHAEQRPTLIHGGPDMAGLDEWPPRPVAIDAIGEGSGLADDLDTRYPDVHRFKAGETAVDDSTYRDCWAEGLYHLGQVLERGCIADKRLREELLVAARTIDFEEVHLSSRGGAVVEATAKDRLRDELGRSPDHLDAAVMAAWADRVDHDAHGKPGPTFSW